jgi:putative cell wall-binding protein
MQNKKTYTDFIINELAKGNVQYKDVCSVFLRKFALSRQTFDKYWKLANEEYSEQRQTIEKEKLITTIETEKQAVKSNILTKNEALEILSEIALGKAKKIEGQIIMPTANERRGAIETISKIQGWNAPIKNENTNTFPDANVLDWVLQNKK